MIIIGGEMERVRNCASKEINFFFDEFMGILIRIDGVKYWNIDFNI